MNLGRDYEDCLRQIRAGEVAAMIGAQAVLEVLANSRPCDLEYLPMVMQGYYSFPVPLGSTLAAPLTKAVLALVESGYVYRQSEAIFHPTTGNLCEPPDFSSRRLSVRNFYGIFAACGIIAFASSWLWSAMCTHTGTTKLPGSCGDAQISAAATSTKMTRAARRRAGMPSPSPRSFENPPFLYCLHQQASTM